MALTVPHGKGEGLVKENITGHHKTLSLNVMKEPGLEMNSHSQMNAPACLAVQLLLLSRGSKVLNHTAPDLEEGDIRPLASKESDEWCLIAWQGLGGENVADERNEGQGEGPPSGREASVPRPRGRTTFPTSTSVGNVVSDVLARGMLPIDENAVYAVLGDERTTQVREGGKHWLACGVVPERYGSPA